MTEVNQLLERFTEAQKMMRQMRKGMGPGMPGMPGLPGMPGAGGGKKARGRTAPPARKGKAKSGNPAKRAQQERDAAARGTRPAPGPAATPGGAFGLGGPAEAGSVDPSNLELPPGFEKFLGR